MNKEDKDKLDELLKAIEVLTDALIGDIQETIPEDSITVFRLTEKVFDELEKEFAEGWMKNIGIT